MKYVTGGEHLTIFFKGQEYANQKWCKQSHEETLQSWVSMSTMEKRKKEKPCANNSHQHVKEIK